MKQRSSLLNYCSFEHFVYNLFYHTRRSDCNEFSIPGVFLRKRIMFVNTNADELTDSSQIQANVVSDSSLISKAFKELRDFISYVKQFNKSDTANYRFKEVLKGKLKMIIRKKNVIPAPSNRRAILGQDQGNSIFKKLVEAKLLQKDSSPEVETKPKHIDLYEKNYKIRQQKNLQSILLSQTTNHESAIHYNIARTSQYKINNPKSQRSKPPDSILGSPGRNEYRGHFLMKGFDGLLAEVYQSKLKYVSKSTRG